MSQERLSFAWRYEWRTPGSVQVTNEGLDTAFDVDVRVTFQAVTGNHRFRRIAGGESVELPLPGLAQYWHAIDQRRAESPQSGPLSGGPIGVDLFWLSRRGARFRDRLEAPLTR